MPVNSNARPTKRLAETCSLIVRGLILVRDSLKQSAIIIKLRIAIIEYSRTLPRGSDASIYKYLRVGCARGVMKTGPSIESGKHCI